jgi:hypothetical protein
MPEKKQTNGWDFLQTVVAYTCIVIVVALVIGGCCISERGWPSQQGVSHDR